jgi:hypothetical protein
MSSFELMGNPFGFCLEDRSRNWSILLLKYFNHIGPAWFNHHLSGEKLPLMYSARNNLA